MDSGATATIVAAIIGGAVTLTVTFRKSSSVTMANTFEKPQIRCLQLGHFFSRIANRTSYPGFGSFIFDYVHNSLADRRRLLVRC
jgi:hypothetical protein